MGRVWVRARIDDWDCQRLDLRTVFIEVERAEINATRRPYDTTTLLEGPKLLLIARPWNTVESKRPLAMTSREMYGQRASKRMEMAE